MPSSIARWKAFLQSGVQLYLLWPWYSVIWAIHPQQESASAVMQQQVRISSMVSILSMHRARTWLPVSVHHSRLLRKVLYVGQNSRALTRKLALQNILLWRRICQRFLLSSMISRTSWRSTIMICRIWSSPYRKAISGSFRLVMVSVLELLWLRLPWTCSTRAKSMRRLLLSVVSPTSLMNFCTQYSTSLLRCRPRC